jgi:DNA gyrase inhibitor GyrI
MSDEKETMNEVRVETLAPARTARFHALSASPENDAWNKVRAWVDPRGLLNDDSHKRVFGRNSPPPSPEEEEYGYEFFIELEPGFEPSDDVEVTEIPGGLCAVVACRGVQNLPEAWRRLYQWVEDSEYEVSDHGLEQNLTPNELSVSELSFDLWLPITL